MTNSRVQREVRVDWSPTLHIVNLKMDLIYAWEIQNSDLISSSILILKSLLHKQQIQRLPKMAKTSTTNAHAHHSSCTDRSIQDNHIHHSDASTSYYFLLFRYQMGEVNQLPTSSTCVHVGARSCGASWEVHVSAPLDCPIVFDRRLRDLCTVFVHRLLSQGSFLYV